MTVRVEKVFETSPLLNGAFTGASRALCKAVLEKAPHVLGFNTLYDLDQRIQDASREISSRHNHFPQVNYVTALARTEIINGMTIGKGLSSELSVSTETKEAFNTLGQHFRAHNAGYLAIQATDMFLESVSRSMLTVRSNQKCNQTVDLT